MAEATTQKRSNSGTERRNLWLLILTVVLIIGSIFLFTPPQERINQGLDIQGGLSVVLTANSTDGAAITDEAMETSRDIIESRVNALGASEATVALQGSNQILVQIPGLSDTQEALNTIGKTGQLEFARLDSFTDETVRNQIDAGNIVTTEYFTDSYGNQLPSGTSSRLKVEAGTYTPIVTGANINRVTVDRPEGSIDWAVDIDLDAEGTAAFAAASRDLVADHGKIVIILDGEVNSAPAVQSEIPNGQVQITGGYSQAEAKALKTVLESGSLPVSFAYAQSQTVGPTLGQDALASGVLVALIGLALVMVYLLVFYRGLGLITAAAMLVFACIYLGLLALLSRFGLFSLSLSGVAGIVLTIGMAADSSILTLERFREEIRFGRSVRSASITGVRHGILTSIDADLVSLVTALTLFFLASSGVKGFGLTLALGILCDIVMMLIFKAPIIRLLAPRQIAKNPGFWGITDCNNAAEVYQRLADAEATTVETAASGEAINSEISRSIAVRKGGVAGQAAHDAIAGLKGRFIKHDIPFLRYRKVFLSIAAVVVVVAIGLIGIRGLNLGIEFMGGTSITFNGTGALTTEELRAAFNEAGETDAVIQSTDTNGEAGFIVRTTESDAAVAAGVAAQVAESVGMTTESFQVNTISPDWGPTIVRSMFIALIVSFILVIAYISLRFRDPKMGVVAVITLLHDILFVVGAYALFGRELNPNTIAALLTIFGYSLYDTVVVFHRIVDNMQNSNIRSSFMTMANHSLNQVFIRSINTSVTSLIPVVFMLIFGSETLKDFAFAMVIGLFIGFYSSIAVAVPLYSIWRSSEDKNVKLTAKFGPEIGGYDVSGSNFTAALMQQGRSAVAAQDMVDESAFADAEGGFDAQDEPDADAAHGAEAAVAAPVRAHAAQGAGGSGSKQAATAAQIAKEKRARQRRAEAKKAAKKAANEEKKAASSGVPEIRIIDQEKFDAATAPAPEQPVRGHGRYSERNRAAAEEQWAGFAAAAEGAAEAAPAESYDTLEDEMNAAAARAEAFEAESQAAVSAAELAERKRRAERAEQAARDRLKAEARRAKREGRSKVVASGAGVAAGAEAAADAVQGAAAEAADTAAAHAQGLADEATQVANAAAEAIEGAAQELEAAAGTVAEAAEGLASEAADAADER